jgi:hypothetical protein
MISRIAWSGRMTSGCLSSNYSHNVLGRIRRLAHLRSTDTTMAAKGNVEMHTCKIALKGNALLNEPQWSKVLCTFHPLTMHSKLKDDRSNREAHSRKKSVKCLIYADVCHQGSTLWMSRLNVHTSSCNSETPPSERTPSCRA